MAMSDEPSYVVEAMVGTERAKSAIRFSLGPTTTEADILQTLKVVAESVSRLLGT